MSSFNHDCEFCGKTYEAKRNTSRFCSAKCRQRNKRSHPSGVNIGVEVTTASWAIQRIMKMSDEELRDEIWRAESLWRDVLRLRQRVGMSSDLNE